MDTFPRLDILLYAHDGRGLGHASRSIAIGMALRRLYPSLKVLFLSGCRLSSELIGKAPLDWLKLPSYETIVEDGISRGIDGKSNFSDHHLGLLRSRQITDIITTYRPRLVLADHTPQGKHKELRPALENPANRDIRWVLGIRGVIGNVAQLGSSLAASLFREHYSDLLWYGDSSVLGFHQLEDIRDFFSSPARECGYVSRLKEIRQTTDSNGEQLAGVVSVPWIGENTPVFLDNLYTSLHDLGNEHGKWEIYLDQGDALSPKYYQLFNQLPWCTIHAPGLRYVEALLQAKLAIIYGGYNSLVDVLSVPVPALVVLRTMRDGEQQGHMDKLMGVARDHLYPIGERLSSIELTDTVRHLFQKREYRQPSINLAGAENSARHLVSLLQKPL